MKKFDFTKYWHAFLHWKGWKATAAFCTGAWNSVVRWAGWRYVFGLPLPVTVALSVASGAGLVWTFYNNLVQSFPAYFLYVLSAYCLAALCMQLPAGIRNLKAWLSSHPKILAFLKNRELRFRLKLYLDQFINFAYGILKVVSGVLIGSAWIGCDGIYNLIQAVIQTFIILRRKKSGTLVQQWKTYRFCGLLILLMHLSLIGIVFQMINWNRADEQGQIMVIATAAFVFYKFIKRFVEIAKDRKHTHPIDSSVRMLELSQAIFAIFSLQASMFHVFGTGQSWEQLLNILTGSTVCLLIVLIGIYMIRRGTREIKKIQEKQHGS